MSDDIDFLLGARISLENAKRLFRCAEALADIGEYGPGHSLLILAVEECVKASVFAAHGVDNLLGDVSNDELFNALRQHSQKHYFGFITLPGSGSDLPLHNQKCVWRGRQDRGRIAPMQSG